MSLKKNVIANYFGNGWAAIMGLVFIPVYIRFLGMEAYGLIGLYAFLQTALVIVDAGLSPTLSREMSRFAGGTCSIESIRDLLRTLEIIGFFVTFVYAFAVWSASDWLAINWLQIENLSRETVAQAFSIMGAVAALRLPEGLYRSAIIGLQRQVLFNVTNAVISTLRNFGAVFVLAFISPTISAYFIWQGVTSLVSMLVFSWLVYYLLPKGKCHGRFSKAELLRVWGYAAGILATTSLALLLTQVDKIILSKLLSLERFGQYSLAATVSSSLLMLVAPITQAYFPKLIELLSAGDLESVKVIYHRGAQLVTVLTSTAACLIIFFEKELIILWTGNQELAERLEVLLIIMTLGTLLNSFMNMPWMLPLAAGRSSLNAKVNLIAVFFITPAILIFTPVYGEYGAAFAWLTLNMGFIFIASHFMHKTILPEEKRRWFVCDLLKPFLAAATTVLFFRFVSPSFHHSVFTALYIAMSGAAAIVASFYASNELNKNMKLR